MHRIIFFLHCFLWY